LGTDALSHSDNERTNTDQTTGNGRIIMKKIVYYPSTKEMFEADIIYSFDYDGNVILMKGKGKKCMTWEEFTRIITKNSQGK
jgi:hypothetical protein